MRSLQEKDRIIVGVNEFITEEKVPIEILKIDPKIEEKLTERLNMVKKQRNNAKVKETLEELRKAAERDENLMPVILKAVKAYATTGEICGVLREVYGEYKPPTIF